MCLLPAAGGAVRHGRHQPGPGWGGPAGVHKAEIAGKDIGVITGFDEVLKDEDLSQENRFTYDPTATDTVMALKAGRVDVVCLDDPVAQLAVNTNEGLAILPEAINKVDYGIIFPKGSDLVEQFNPVIARFREDGAKEKVEFLFLSAMITICE